MPTSQCTTDKLSFDVGLCQTPNDESAWWMVACASKNRSEGEKVRVSDDIILSSVSSERYLHLAPLSNTEKAWIHGRIDCPVLDTV